MRISAAKPVEPNKPAREASAGAPERTADPVSLSARSRAARRLKELVDALPDLREERVRRLREAIENGSYRVSGRDVAEKLLAEASLRRPD